MKQELAEEIKKASYLDIVDVKDGDVITKGIIGFRSIKEMNQLMKRFSSIDMEIVQLRHSYIGCDYWKNDGERKGMYTVKEQLDMVNKNNVFLHWKFWSPREAKKMLADELNSFDILKEADKIDYTIDCYRCAAKLFNKLKKGEKLIYEIGEFDTMIAEKTMRFCIGPKSFVVGLLIK